MRHIEACRTAALGGHVDTCDECGHIRISYNSCRDRHCPKCQSFRREAWLEARFGRLLSVDYFHVVFTLPDGLNALVLRNRDVLYNLLFRSASETLLTIASDPKHLGAQIGFTAILHTWGQRLGLHPHLHCVVTGGGLSEDGLRWIASRKTFFLPVRVLARMFRGKFLRYLADAHKAGRLRFGGKTAPLADTDAFRRFVSALYRKEWIVYAKPPFGGPERVFRYLGRYTHRVAIANSRLVAFEEGRVRFGIKDYADGGRTKVMTLDAAEFIQRFLLHVLPKGFTRIRHFGLFAGRNTLGKLEQARRLLGQRRPQIVKLTWEQRYRALSGRDPMACPACGRHLSRHLLPRDRDLAVSEVRAINSS